MHDIIMGKVRSTSLAVFIVISLLSCFEARSQILSLEGSESRTKITGQSISPTHDKHASAEETIPKNERYLYPDVIGVISLEDASRLESSNIDAYAPGKFSMNSMSDDKNLRLCNGLIARLIGQSGKKILRSNGKRSRLKFHIEPNSGSVFSKKNGGWYLLSNSCSSYSGDKIWKSGGVGTFEFDADGNLKNYRRSLTFTNQNTGGGRTPWNSWISCSNSGCWQIDPQGARQPSFTALALQPDFQSFAYYITEYDEPEFFVIQNLENGVLTRFRPNKLGMKCYHSDDPWCTLKNGSHDFLVLKDDYSFYWTSDISVATMSGFDFFRNTTWMEVEGKKLYLFSNVLNQVVSLNFKNMSFKILHGIQKLKPLVGNENFYFAKGRDIYLRMMKEEKFLPLIYAENELLNETATILFSPNQEHMYLTYQENGVVYDVTRSDNQTFDGRAVGLNYEILL
jgi:hypothetical protein